ncbi:Tigger transposable element-derived protein 4 [Frankliniella fusca]|uniref:Tigger transposable element-derived protein 4 n=1 Tax=Frankliniella fusca TaxID=407009 RepID=A0AAE1LD97_9NEOP|nr:Tigger transposable element-derived protein 4 [Frankliniella fusca]
MPSTSKIEGIDGPGKKRRLSVSVKLDILKIVDGRPNATKKDLATEIGTPVSTLSDIIKNRSKWECAAGHGNLRARKLKVPKYSELEEALVKFIGLAGSMQVKIPINPRVLKVQAKTITLRLGITDFKKRGGDASACQGSRGNTEFSSRSSLWYELKDIYNADEFGLFFNPLPNSSICLEKEDNHGNKQSKARLTDGGSNADGSDKLTPLLIGKSKKTRCFANIRSLPCDYASQETRHSAPGGRRTRDDSDESESNPNSDLEEIGESAECEESSEEEDDVAEDVSMSEDDDDMDEDAAEAEGDTEEGTASCRFAA